MELKWEEPPKAALIRAQSRSGGQYLDIAIALRERPEQWAKINKEFGSEKSAQSTAQNMRRGITKGFTRGEFEIVADGCSIWARYMGPNEEAQDPRKPAEGAGATSAGDNQPASLAPRIREWAREHGFEVPERGRIPQDIRDQFFANNPDVDLPPPLRAVPQA